MHVIIANSTNYNKLQCKLQQKICNYGKFVIAAAIFDVNYSELL